MKTAISMPDEVFTAAEKVRRRLRLSRSAFYAQAVSTHIETCGGRKVRDALAAVYSTQPADLDPLLETLQAEALREEW